jgi:hypothetical protein
MTDKKQNTGEWNTGDRNTGEWNTGDRNTGDCNTGDLNTGNLNTGDCNTGEWNTGDRNTGYWNTGDLNTGYFNTETPDQINIFDKPASRADWNDCDKPDFIYFSIAGWVPMSEMTEKEKSENPDFGYTGGYLKKLDYKEEFKKSYEKASSEDRAKIHNLPNFCPDKFLEISGIDVRIDSEQEAKKQELIRKANELLEQAKKM